MTGSEPIAQRPAVIKDRHSAMTRNADGKRPGKAVKILTDLVRSFLKETKDQRKEHEASIEGLMTEIESLQALVLRCVEMAVSEASNLVYRINDRDQKTFRLRSAPQYATNVT